MPLLIIKIVFLILSGVSGYVVVQNISSEPTPLQAFQGVAVGVGVAAVIFALEVILRKYFVDAIAGIMFGIVAGFVISYIIFQSLNLLAQDKKFLANFQIPLTLIICYVCVAVVLQTKDKFKFIIPYLDFRSGEKSPDYLVLDTSVIVDSRIFRLLKMRIFTEKVIIPAFVMEEIQTLADSKDKTKREKGKRALNLVRRMREDIFLDIQVYYENFEGNGGGGVDGKLVLLAKKINGMLATTDGNLERIAEAQGVKVLNINEMACALRLEVIAGEKMEVEILRRGEEGKNQGVGFLPDGTMVVVEEGGDRVGETVKVEVTNSVQTAAGKMVFTKIV